MKNQLFPEINESEARFWAAFDSSAIGMGLLSLDGKILQVNDAVVKMSGFNRDELIGRFDNQNVLPEDQNLGMDMFQELIDGKRDWFQVEKRYLRKNGDVFWTRLTLSVVRGEAGQPLYLVGLIDDIDENKKSQQALQESEARFRAMFDNAVVGITLIAPDRRVLAINPAVVKMSGYTEAELLAMTGQDITHPDDMSIARNSPKYWRGDATLLRLKNAISTRTASFIGRGSVFLRYVMRMANYFISLRLQKILTSKNAPWKTCVNQKHVSVPCLNILPLASELWGSTAK